MPKVIGILGDMPLPIKGAGSGIPETNGTDERDERVEREERDFRGCEGITGEVGRLLAKYIVMDYSDTLVTATWTVAAYLMDVWERFPHLGLTSPEKRCGKTLLLKMLELITPRGKSTVNISPPALFRVIQAERPT